jgi:hypothetical protein
MTSDEDWKKMNKAVDQIYNRPDAGKSEPAALLLQRSVLLSTHPICFLLSAARRTLSSPR